MATSTPDISALAAYPGTYEKKLFSTLINGLDAMNDLTVIQNVKKALNMTKLKVGKGARPYAVANEARTSDLQFTGRVLSVDPGKRDLLIEPEKYRTSWMSEVMKPGVNPRDIPFVAYTWDAVFKELASEINDNTIYFGFDKSIATVYSAIATYAVGDVILFTGADGIVDYWKCLAITTAAQTPITHPAKWQMVNAEAICVGFAKRIVDAIAASQLTPVATGAITNTTAYAQFTQLWRSMPVPYLNAQTKIYSSWTSMFALQDDFENKNSKYVEIDPLTSKMYLAKTSKKCEIVPASWMGTSGRLICTPAENMLVGTDLTSDLNKVQTETHIRTLEAGIDFLLGTQIRDTDAMRVNDQA